MDQKFVHLHTHSHYSLLDGMSKIENMVKLAKKHEMPALALTDHGNMYGAIEFYKVCKEAGIKPIIGVEAYIAERTRHDKESGLDSKRYHLTLLAQNITGYKNLMKMVTISNLEGYYYKPRMDKDLLRENHEGIICLSGCMGGELSSAVKNKNSEKAKSIIKEYQDIFGKENYFIEIMNHPNVEGDKEIREGLILLAKEFDIPLVATQDSHYPCPEDHHAHETLLAIQTGVDTKDENRFTFGVDDFSLINTETALEYFKNTPEAVFNTAKVADMCNLELELGKWVFPNLVLKNENSYDEELERLAMEGLEKRGMERTPEIEQRLRYELDVIKNKGYSPYFLVVADLLEYATANNIFTNIRGSVSGSLVTYLSGITKINPLEYNIPFERFLNPDRPSPPDIDMDFADNRRDEMLEYAKKKYGEDRVAQIGTFGTMMARGAVRDVARALGYPYAIGDRISKLIPMGSQGMPMTIDHAMELVPELKEAYEKEKDAKEIIDLAKKLEGCVRHISVHAAGVVISPRPIYEFTPIQLDPKGGKIITQYDMYSVEEAGLLKFDFLGIRNLSILEDAVKIVKKMHKVDIDMENIPLNDRKTFVMLARGDTEGVFQLNGSGMTRYLKELKPTTIHDINAMVALFRPGPMQFIPEYIKRKHNPRLIRYLDPALEKILSQTYGILVYQDDLLMMAHELAGYTWGEVDKFRKAVGKKIPEEMEAQKAKFIDGCIKHSNWSQKKATEIWKWIEPFAAYGFNKAHSVSYGRVAYQTAYMKANYPIEYMTAILTAESGDVEKIAEIIKECSRMKIPVLPPNVNESFGGFTVIRENNKEEIRFGLYTIKNLGTDISDAIIEERKKNGKFTSITNFLDRIKHKNLNKKSLEALIKSGSMDEFEERGKLLFNMEDLLAYNREINKGNQNQGSLFGASVLPFEIKLKESEQVKAEERLAWEKELLGLYISGHPLDKWRDKIEKREINIKKIKESFGNEREVTFAGIIESVRPVITKKNDKMAFLRIADFSDSIEVVAFPKIFRGSGDLIEPDKCVALSGKVSLRNGEKSIIMEKVKLLV